MCRFVPLVMSFCLATEIFNKAAITYYIPQCEHYMEARWWNEILLLLENFAGLPENYFKTLFIIETLPAAYQVEAILHETLTRTMCAGYRDKITSDLRIVTKKVDFVLPERIHLDMQNPYVECSLYQWYSISIYQLNDRGLKEIEDNSVPQKLSSRIRSPAIFFSIISISFLAFSNRQLQI